MADFKHFNKVIPLPPPKATSEASATSTPHTKDPSKGLRRHTIWAPFLEWSLTGFILDCVLLLRKVFHSILSKVRSSLKISIPSLTWSLLLLFYFSSWSLALLEIHCILHLFTLSLTKS